MDESEDNMSAEDIKASGSPLTAKSKPKKRSIIERELETSLTARVTSPVTHGDGTSTSRYGRARRLKTEAEQSDNKKVTSELKSPVTDKSPMKTQSPAYKMHASNSPLRPEQPKIIGVETFLENQIENIYQENVSLSRFGTEEVESVSPSPAKKFPKVYIRKDLIQSRETDVNEKILIKNMFSPVKSASKSSNTHLNNILERSSERYTLVTTKQQNGFLDNSSVVKTLDFDGKKKKKESKEGKTILSKSDLFELEAKCAYQVGDLAWARMGTYPFWPSIVTRDPSNGIFVKKKLFGRIERDVIHVTFFGDNGRRGWIVDTMLRKYLGQLEFESARENFTAEDKKKDPRLYAAFFVSEKKQALWNNSVEESEMLFREPKRLRIDIFNDMLVKSRSRGKQQKSGKISRTDSDVSLSESLYDSLFSEDDGKTDTAERSRNRSRNKSLDVFEVVTACLDNMAAKTGITKIQRQSHMDRWLQKAKSKTPEKTQAKPPQSKVEEKKETKVSSSKKKKSMSKTTVKKPYSLRKSMTDSQNLLPFQNEHDYSKNVTDSDQNSTDTESYKNVACKKPNGIPNIAKVESLCNKSQAKDEKNTISDDGHVENAEEISTKANGTCDSSESESIDANNQDSKITSTGELKPTPKVSFKINHDTEESSTLQHSTHTGDTRDQMISPVYEDSYSDDIQDDQSTKNYESIDETEDMSIPTNTESETEQCGDAINDNSTMASTDMTGQSFMSVDDDDTSDYKPTTESDSQTEDNSSLTDAPFSNDSVDTDIEENISGIHAGRDSVPDSTAKNTGIRIDSKSAISRKDINKSNKENNDKNYINETDMNKSVTNKLDNGHIDNENDILKNSEMEINNRRRNKEDENYIAVPIDKISNDIPNLDIVDSISNIVPKNCHINVQDIDMNLVNEVHLPSSMPQAIKENGFHDESNLMNGDIDMDTVSVHSVDSVSSTKSETKRKLRSKNDKKQVNPLENAEFVKYVEMRQDALIDENPELTQDEIVAYLYKTWIYEEGGKSDAKKNDDLLESNLVKGLNSEPVAKIKRKEIEEIKQRKNRKSLSLNRNTMERFLKRETSNRRERMKKQIEVNDAIEERPSSSLDSRSLKEVNYIIHEKSASSIENNLQKDVNDIKQEKSDSTKVNRLPKEQNESIQERSDSLINSQNEDDTIQEKSDITKVNEVNDSNQESTNSSINYSLHKEVQETITSVIDNISQKELTYSIQEKSDESIVKSSKNEIDHFLDNALPDSDIPETSVMFQSNTLQETYPNNETEIALGSQCNKNNRENKDVSTDPNDQIQNNTETESAIGEVDTQSKEESTKSPIHPSNAIKVNFQQEAEKTELKEDFDRDSVDSEDSEAPLIKCKLRSKPKKEDYFKDHTKIKEEELDTISINSEDSEVSLTKRKKKFASKKLDNALADPEFVKYMELRQDALVEENPQLSQDEIISYLYQTWLYEESMKSEIKKSDEIEQSGLVKGLKESVQQPKKIKRKVKIEKEIDDCLVPKDKPKRKVIKPYYNEEYSDIEEELEVFSIFNSQNKKSGENSEEPVVIQEVNNIDEVELYFEELAKPKPNVFKGLVREKVCEMCEMTGHLAKCKGCSGMFHVECVNKVVIEVETPAPTRGRKKKKKLGRKPKNSDEFDNHDDKSQDVSEENNASIEEIIELESHTVDADTLEAQLEAKMKEILEAEKIEYDSYSSDDGCDWSDTVPGKCEIIDVKLKPRQSSSEIDYSNFKCKNCQKYDTPICFVCKSAVSKNETLIRQKCHVAHCHKYYHLGCLDHWPQSQFNGGEPSKNNKKINEYFEALTCPRHVCHTCVSDDPRGCKTRFSGDKLARCVRCPATYHSFTKCLPAGTQILTASHIICPRHYEHMPGKVPCHVNTGWCFICALGGSLICCEYCPTSFHAECLNIKPPEGGYMCEDCETGRLPLYGEMVWVKLGHYRWWPGIILHPSEIPENIMAVKHNLGEFVVRFFGQYDHYWVNRGRVFPFQEGDSGRVSSQKSKIDAAFTTAMEHAQRACEILKSARPNEEESLDIASSLLPPHYVKLKVNKPCGSLCGRRLEDPESSLTQCECNPNDDDPCGPYSQCLNRMLLTECGPTCRASDRCNNRAFEKRLYPKLVPYRTPSRGWGLKTLEDIKAGQFVIEYVGELIDEEEFRRRMRRKHEIRDENFYFLTLDKERMIDAGPKGNLARFMNHCCEPNCETQKWTVLGDVRVGLFALYDIPANSEVTFNYNLECAGIEKKRCMCGAKRCSGYIGAKPKQDESQSKKPKIPGKRTYKKRKTTEESPSTKNKPKRPIGRPPKPRELTEIEKDLLIIRNATNGISSDESSRSMSSEYERNPKALKRKRVSFSTEEIILYDGSESPSVKKHKLEENCDVGD